jgi:hypothetical protein
MAVANFATKPMAALATVSQAMPGFTGMAVLAGTAAADMVAVATADCLAQTVNLCAPVP